MKDGKGYLVPDPIDPGSTRCIRFHVPDDILYIAAFWGAMDFFTKWVAWERGGTKGKEAAAVWMAAYEQSRTEWESEIGCGVIDLDLRLKPGDPCTIEIDRGSGWEELYNTFDCLWGTPTGAYEIPPDTGTSEEAAAADLVDAMDKILEIIVVDYESGVPSFDTISRIKTVLGWFAPGVDFTQIAIDIDQGVRSHFTAQEARDAKDAIDWEKAYKEYACKSDPTGHWLDELSDLLAGILNGMSDGLAHLLSDAASVLGGQGLTQMAKSNPGGGTGFGFGSVDCNTLAEFRAGKIQMVDLNHPEAILPYDREELITFNWDDAHGDIPVGWIIRKYQSSQFGITWTAQDTGLVSLNTVDSHIVQTPTMATFFEPGYSWVNLTDSQHIIHPGATWGAGDLVAQVEFPGYQAYTHLAFSEDAQNGLEVQTYYNTHSSNHIRYQMWFTPIYWRQ
jgi:hypothetical protein